MRGSWFPGRSLQRLELSDHDHTLHPIMLTRTLPNQYRIPQLCTAAAAASVPVEEHIITDLCRVICKAGSVDPLERSLHSRLIFMPNIH